MSNSKQAFTKRFCDWRAGTGMSRRELSRALDVTEQTLINWEKGTAPSIEPLARLAVYSGLSVDWWLGLTDVMSRLRVTRRKAR